MKLGYMLLFLMFLVANSTFGQIEKVLNQNQQDFRLQGRVIDTQFEEDGTSLYVKLKLQFDLTNIGNRSLMFWKQDEPIFLGKALSKHYSFVLGDLIESHFGGPSIDTSEKWKKLRESLDKETPSSDVIRTLLPNETWSFVSQVTIVTTKEIGLQNQLTFEKLRSLSPLWIKVFFEVWSPNIEPNIKERSELKFGKALQKRWRKVGYLWLDNIVSEPISLDLSFTVVKSDSQP